MAMVKQGSIRHPEDWPVDLNRKPVTARPLRERVAALKAQVESEQYGPNDRIGLMVNAADLAELLAALEAAK